MLTQLCKRRLTEIEIHTEALTKTSSYWVEFLGQSLKYFRPSNEGVPSHLDMASLSTTHILEALYISLLCLPIGYCPLLEHENDDS